jgi:hypothetical protein
MTKDASLLPAIENWDRITLESQCPPFFFPDAVGVLGRFPVEPEMTVGDRK